MGRSLGVLPYHTAYAPEKYAPRESAAIATAVATHAIKLLNLTINVKPLTYFSKIIIYKFL